MLREAIIQLEMMGQFPSYADKITDEQVTNYDRLIRSIVAPINSTEAVTLAKLLNEDDFYGLAWSVIHLIETAPNWPIQNVLDLLPATWRETLEERLSNNNET